MPLGFPSCPICGESADKILGTELYRHEPWRQLIFLMEEKPSTRIEVVRPGERCFVCDRVSRTGKLWEVRLASGRTRLLGNDCLRHLQALFDHYAQHA